MTNITIPKKVVEQALDALCNTETPDYRPQYGVEYQAIYDLRCALAQCEAEEPAQHADTLTHEDIVRMAKEAGWGNLVSMPHTSVLERFAALVAARQLQMLKMTTDEWIDQNVSGHPDLIKAMKIIARKSSVEHEQLAAWPDHQQKSSCDSDMPHETGQSITSRSSRPADWKLVPVEPTPAMEQACMWATQREDIWEAMLAAAPQPPTTEQYSAVQQPQVEQEPEYWRPVVGFEGLYEVSSRGDIRNLKTNAVLAKNKMGAGYIKADLWKLGTRTQTSAHRIVAEAFLGNTKGLEVNHINGDKSDNRVSNLEIVTKNENESHSRYVLGNLVKPVIARNLTSDTEFEFKSVNAARAAGFLPSSVYKCCYGICKQHKGHSFRFKNPDHANGEKVSSVTHPQPPRQPLTRKKIQELVIEVCDTLYPQDESSYSEADSVFYTTFVRAVERAHNINHEGE